MIGELAEVDDFELLSACSGWLDDNVRGSAVELVAGAAVLVEATQVAVAYHPQPSGVSELEKAKAKDYLHHILGLEFGCKNNGNGLLEHLLVATVGVQVNRTEEALLCGVCVHPA